MIKVQYPGVNKSIDSDLDNLMMLVKVTNMAPKQMYLNQIVDHTRQELKGECDYLLEA